MRVALPLVVVLLASGCTVDTTRTTGAGEDVAALAFRPPVLPPQGSSALDPLLAVGPEGTIWITAISGRTDEPNAVESSAWLWRSKDEGATWEEVRGPVRERDVPEGTGRPFGNADMDLAIGDSGRIAHVAWWGPRPPVVLPPDAPTVSGILLPGNFVLEISDDAGDTWVSRPITALGATTLADAPRIIVGDGGRLWLAYAQFRPDLVGSAESNPGTVRSAFEMHVIRSDDDGVTWSTPTIILPVEPRKNMIPGNLKRSSEGVLVMPYAYKHFDRERNDRNYAPGDVRVMRSVDDGATWTSVLVAEALDGFGSQVPAQIATGPEGTMAVAWSDWAYDRLTVRVSESSDGGETWTAPATLRDEGSNFAPRPHFATDGRLSVAWYASDATGEPPEAPEATIWSVRVATQDAERPGWNQTPVADVRTGPICTRGSSCAVLGQYDWLGIGHLSDGRVAVAYTAGPSEDPPLVSTWFAAQT